MNKDTLWSSDKEHQFYYNLFCDLPIIKIEYKMFINVNGELLKVVIVWAGKRQHYQRNAAS